MPKTEVLFYCDEDGKAPVLEWLVELERKNQRAVEKCTARIALLEEFGFDLRRPIADLLRDGIYELRVRDGRSQYRLLYFFHGQNVAIVAHGLVKEREVPKEDINRALERKLRFEQAPEQHTYHE